MKGLIMVMSVLRNEDGEAVHRMTSTFRCAYRWVVYVVVRVLIVLLVATLLCPADAQLITLVVTGYAVSKKDGAGHGCASLYPLDVHFTNTTDTGLVRKGVVQTDSKGRYSMTVSPGRLDIRVIGTVKDTSNARPQVWLEGHLDGFRVGVPGGPVVSLPELQLRCVKITQ